MDGLGQTKDAGQGKKNVSGRQLVVLLLVVIAASALTSVCHRIGWLSGLESMMLDSWILSRTRTAEHVYVVGVSDHDYHDLFKDKSPLDPRVVSELLAAIAQGEPALIVVDLDTSDPAFDSLSLPSFKGKIVWARGASELPLMTEKTLSERILKKLSLFEHHEAVFVQEPLLGQTKPAADLRYGLAVLPEDADGVVRHYRRRVKVVEKPYASRFPREAYADALAWATAVEFNPSLAMGPADTAREYVLTLSGGPQYVPRITAGNLLKVYRGSGWKDLVDGKIVLLGGYYGAARDSYVTPAGRTAGVDLLAETVESELAGSVRSVSDVVLFWAQVLVGLLYGFVLFRYSGSRKPLLALCAIVLIAVAISVALFNTLSLWFDFVPVLFVVYLLYLLNHVVEIQRTNAELRRLNAELVRTRNELGLAVNKGAENERRRLAQELHDDTLHYLFQVSVTLDPLSRDEKAGGQRLVPALDTVKEAMKNIREIIENLYPSVFDKYGCVRTIQRLLNKASESGWKTDLSDKTEKLIDGLERETQLAIYRIVEQAINNIQKHAEAKEIKVSMTARDGVLAIAIQDDGKGMDTSTQKADSYGLQSMRDKAAILGASIHWVSPPPGHDTGTLVVLSLPVPARTEDNK